MMRSWSKTDADGQQAAGRAIRYDRNDSPHDLYCRNTTWMGSYAVQGALSRSYPSLPFTTCLSTPLNFTEALSVIELDKGGRLDFIADFKWYCASTVVEKMKYARPCVHLLTLSGGFLSGLRINDGKSVAFSLAALIMRPMSVRTASPYSSPRD